MTFCLRFVFYVVVDFFQVCLGTKLLRIEGESWLMFMLSFCGRKVRVDGCDLILFCVVVFFLVILKIVFRDHLWLFSEEMHLRFNEREFDQLRSTGCGSGDRQMVDFKKMDL